MYLWKYLPFKKVITYSFVKGSNKMTLGKWSFFAIVLDGQAQQGFIQLDYAFGFNNGTADGKVSS
jgi:hypothetical protein